VTAAQAFHWFDRPRALAEFRRLLRPGGLCAAVWNLRAPCPFLDEYERLLVEFSPDYGAIEDPRDTLEKLALASRGRARRAEFPFAQRFDLESFLRRAASSSYVALGVRDRPAFDAALRALFARHAREGSVEFPYATTALLFLP
jgi:SAM-dependent methyltransferase